MDSRFSKIGLGRLALTSALDRAEIEALIREAIALLVVSGELQTPHMRGPDPGYGRGVLR
jgi:hypothetical protein